MAQMAITHAQYSHCVPIAAPKPPPMKLPNKNMNMQNPKSTPAITMKKVCFISYVQIYLCTRLRFGHFLRHRDLPLNLRRSPVLPRRFALPASQLPIP